MGVQFHHRHQRYDHAKVLSRDFCLGEKLIPQGNFWGWPPP